MFHRKNNATVTFTFLVLLILLCQPVSFAAVNYYYDANGNMIRDTGVGRCYGFNDANRLSNITDCGGSVLAQYWYDESGQRIKSVENGVTAYYPFPEYETQVGGSNPGNTSYFYVNGERVARKDPDGSMHYYSGDQLGSTVLLTNSTGVVEENTKYLPYGKVLSGGTKTKYLFNSKELSALSNLYYYGARYYNPELMRFIQPDQMIPDPYDPQTLNGYSYVRNNPIKYTDSSGNYIESLFDIASLVWSLNDLLSNPFDPWNWAATGADAICLAMPVVTGGGTVVRAAKVASKGDDLYDSLKFFLKYADNLDDMRDTARMQDAVFAATKSTAQLGTRYESAWLNGYKTLEVGEGGLKVYRVIGGTETRKAGSWVTTFDPRTMDKADYINRVALPGSNSALEVVEVTLPRGTKINTGITAPLFGGSGGLPQVEILLPQKQLDLIFDNVNGNPW